MSDVDEGAKILNDLRFWMQTFEDERRTVVCPPGLGDQVRDLAERMGAAGSYDIYESSACPAGQILVIDHNAVEASTRQALQSYGR